MGENMNIVKGLLKTFVLNLIGQKMLMRVLSVKLNL